MVRAQRDAVNALLAWSKLKRLAVLSAPGCVAIAHPTTAQAVQRTIQIRIACSRTARQQREQGPDGLHLPQGPWAYDAALQRAMNNFCEEPRLLFTMPANRRRCSFAVSLHGLRRHHHQCNSPRIVPRPRVGEIWLGRASRYTQSRQRLPRLARLNTRLWKRTRARIRQSPLRTTGSAIWSAMSKIEVKSANTTAVYSYLTRI